MSIQEFTLNSEMKFCSTNHWKIGIIRIINLRGGGGGGGGNEYFFFLNN